jgi:fructokinase
MVFDANLRPPYHDREIVRQSLHRADVVKVSRPEMRRLIEWFDLPKGEQTSVRAVAETFDCRVVCLTRGRQGAGMWRDGAWTEHPGFEVEVRDTVGAGDAFLAVLLAGLLEDMDSVTLLHNANLIGAYVVTQFGALPADQPAPGAADSVDVRDASARPGTAVGKSRQPVRRPPRADR